MEANRFVIWDYVVFGLFLALSSLVGIFYAVRDFRRKSDETEEYLMAKRKMHYVPVALSLTVSFMSAVTILGTSREVYLNGLVFWWLMPPFIISAVIIAEVYIPIFYRLKISSSYEYLELRFNRLVRILATAFFVVETIMYVGIVIYAPALAIEKVTGFQLQYAVLSTGIVCTFYTTLGGLKGVIWTDVLQIIIMCAGLLAIIIQGSIELNGFTNIWNIAVEGGRINMGVTDPDPRVVHSLWSLLVGGTFLWLGLYAASQSQVQRYLCCKSERESKIALYLNFIGLFAIISFTCMCGLVMYAYYRDCDPISAGKIPMVMRDQLLPYLVMDLLGKFPGLPGIFVACVYSGSLSTVSTGINAMACVTVEDFIKPFTKYSDHRYCWISRGLGIVYGGLAVGMAFFAHAIGGEVLKLAISIFGLINGPLVGVFTLGMIFPIANSWGALAGLLSGLGSTIWLYVGANANKWKNSITPSLPFSTEGCPTTTPMWNETTSAQTSSLNMMDIFNATTEAQSLSDSSSTSIIDFYSISYLYHSCIGFAFTLIIGLIISAITLGHRDTKKIHPKLIFFVFDHWSLRWLPIAFRRVMRCGVKTELKVDARSEDTEMQKAEMYD